MATCQSLWESGRVSLGTTFSAQGVVLLKADAQAEENWSYVSFVVVGIRRRGEVKDVS